MNATVTASSNSAKRRPHPGPAGNAFADVTWQFHGLHPEVFLT